VIHVGSVSLQEIGGASSATPIAMPRGDHNVMRTGI